MRYFKGKQFKKFIIWVVVGYYCRLSLSDRDISELLRERGVITIVRLIKKDTPDIQLRKTRNHPATYMFTKRLAKAFRGPMGLTIDKTLSLICAFKKLKNNDFYIHMNHCIVKHFNNLIEQDHRHILAMFFQIRRISKSFPCFTTLKVIESSSYINKTVVYRQTAFFQHTKNYTN
ncbi:IS6 family transposase [Bacillus cereus]|uniref:IS6 family transposase n=2 Tax=Bacillus cereus TaxID=1396 RepID=A0A9X7G9W1_BACCE|nr:IS6 family transposase [Bacillus cereus]PFV11561.1 IS6 family transposase [Bacillus cereus]